MSEERLLEDGLITPRSAGTVSPVLDTERNALIARLTPMTKTDFRKTAVAAAFPDRTWAEICAAVENMPIPEELTWPELQLVVLEWHRAEPINFAMLEEECFARDRKSIHARIMHLEEIYGAKRNGLACPIICAFELAAQNQMLTYTEISPFLPGYSLEELRTLVASNFPHRMRFTRAEVDSICDGLRKGLGPEDLKTNLPFRRIGVVRQKALTLKNKFNILKVEPKNTEYEKIIDLIIRSDLTDTGIKEAAHNESLSKLIKDIQTTIEDRGGSESIPFTKPENEILRLSLQGELTDKQCQSELLFRSWREILQKRTELESVHSRQKKFSSHLERLIYEAQWYSSMAEDSARGSRRRLTRTDVEFSDLREKALKAKEQKKPVNGPETQEKIRTNELITLKRKETRRRNLEEKERKKLQHKAPPIRTRSKTKSRSGEKGKIEKLVEEAEWFQSICGDGHTVLTGEKRKRTPVMHLVPEFKDRQKLKTAQKQLMEQKKNKSKCKPDRLMSETPMTEDSEAEKESMEKFKNVMETENPSDLEEISPYDPTDINHDTSVTFENRVLFNEAISSRILFPSRIEFSSDVLEILQPGKLVPINNTLAANIIREHDNCYKSLPDTFPPFQIQNAAGEMTINPRNIIHIRYLLYPQHTEQYILAEPKSNQLDPIREIIKVFQIHYGLFFSYSPKLKNIIYDDFCQSMILAVDGNDFLKFMYIIDKWNALMLELSPYPIEIDPKIDINGSLRVYLPKSYAFCHDIKESKIQTFYTEVLHAGEKARKNGNQSPANMFQRKMSLTLKLPVIGGHQSHLPEVFVSRYRHMRPMAYSVAFIDLLANKTDISRYCSHQLLMRAYTRIVSPSSRKLRSYKAFSAEVYGELLPSFVSEVLTKINYKPDKKFYDLGCGVGNTTLQAALEFGAEKSGGCEIMDHASRLAREQEIFMRKQILLFGLKAMNLSFALDQSFVKNEKVRKECIESDVVLVNNYLFEFALNDEVGKLLYGMKPGSKIISLKNFIQPRYKSSGEKSIFDYLQVERFEMSDYCSVSWTANKVPYYISTVKSEILKEYL
ncbi:DOT1-domain-containing protein [Metschnikowia bicuspidata var. bicuspidata NRRL YB-4993]|uniref:Histone-lysine N-methyltransferase, H3 lysine-79 specific n=1 Tax=Metschnikowia bicuspidata var. bicuspidata NRRL YB-4993 TaxID=869754 RepID=A0A1A0HER0_9ASCO|nr:DOT1-domain-containing protein [Metschnikowia bicuspidata var. bicuspidata NRRL YB-4993]OBA22460.1 DOT1-domain-containing protein [Metschnikowia bicuspidata var. bicuspidata NRRL YB-4993]